VEHTARDLTLPLLGQGGIRQIDAQQDVLFFNCRAEQQWPLSIDGQLEPRQKASASVVEALGTCSDGKDVAVSVKHTERVALLQNFNVVIGQ
jgi:hypothetical protein